MDGHTKRFEFVINIHVPSLIWPIASVNMQSSSSKTYMAWDRQARKLLSPGKLMCGYLTWERGKTSKKIIKPWQINVWLSGLGKGKDKQENY